MKRILSFATIALVLTLDTAHASSVVTSKAYVDAMDDTKVDIAQGTGDNNANVGKTLVVNSSGNLELGTPAAGNYVEDSITDGVANKAPSENAVHDALAGKQDEIHGYNSSTEVQSVLTDTTNDGQIGKIELVTLERMENEDRLWDDYTDPENEKIPTVDFVANMMEAESQHKIYGGDQYTGKVIVAGSRAGFPDYVATYDGSGTYTAATDAGKIATAAAVETKQDKKTCAGWLDGTTVPDATHTDANCVLWNLPD